MNNKFIALLTFLLLICQLTAIPTAIAAKNIDDLVTQGKLAISLKVNQKPQHIVGQALVLAIEISTDRWFATGSQVEHFTLTNVVMQANNTITINGSKRIKGQTWAIQTHEITLYPTKSGDYQVPPITVKVSVNTESDGIVSGEFSTQASSFTVELPQALAGIKDFIVSPQVTLSIDGLFDEEKDYAVGDAITQTITITASDIPAMMIKPINLVVNNEATQGKTEVDGVSIYHKTAQVFDKSNRGSLLGTRVESYTYIFEEPGHYVIAEQVIYWWNSQSSTLERLLIPASSWRVSGEGLSQVNPANRLKGLNFTVETIIAFVIVILLLALTYVGFIKRHYLSALFNKLTKREQRLLRSHFLTCITNHNYLAATQYLYQYALFSNKQTHQKNCPLFDKLNKLAFNENNVENGTVSLSINEAKSLIKKIDVSTKGTVKSDNFIPNERIKLNSE
ncbi:BatD family protein [Colwellia sp. 12G3]|uniref:BatD family protein n=1 Tax=Colwellia sp. 12G3 TaxID=2058299 RepID=UPI000C331098|nr:BatD family protein [Colwellia sp. 12G3]PKI17553.1 hypothetical protein CXF71_03920 [Colwellia sp. 12G3]